VTVPLPGRPWASPGPYTFVLNGTGVMGGTVDRQTTEYTSTKPEDQTSVQPPAYGYGADNPAFGAITKYAAFPLGMGLRAQRSTDAGQDLEYDYTLGVDASVYPIVKGPDVTLFTPGTTDATNGVVRFMKIPGGGNYYAITGRYALLRVNDASWTNANDFGAGKIALDALAFYSNGVGAAYGFVAMGDADHFWSVTAGAWTQHATLFARTFGNAAGEFWRAHTTNTLAKVNTDADPLTAANWGAANAFTVGDKSSPIVRLPTAASGDLLAVKTDGVYTLDEAGEDHQLHAFLPDDANGRCLARWGNDTYVGFTYGGFWRLDTDGSGREQVGPELLTDGSNVVSGVVTQCVGTPYALYGGFYNPDSGNAYLCKFLGMTTREGRPHPVWHGSLTQALPAKVTAMDVQLDGAPSGHARVYLGFANGSLGWFTLPCTPHPADCSSYRFTTADGTLRLPTWDGGFGANTKALDAVSATARNFSTSTYATVATRSDPAASFTALTGAFDTGQVEKIYFPLGTTATILDVQATLTNTATTASPQLTGIGLHHQVHTPYRQVYEIRILAENGLRRRDGTPMRLGREAVKAVIEAAASTAAGVPLVLPDGSTVRVRIKGVEKTVAVEWPTRRTRAAYALECVEVSAVVTYGTHERLMAQGSHAALMTRTHAQLMAL
jgi:hypothetical protein